MAHGDLWGGHPIDAWYYPYRTRGRRGSIEPQARFLNTWERDGTGDILFRHGMRPYHNLSLHEIPLPRSTRFSTIAPLFRRSPCKRRALAQRSLLIGLSPPFADEDLRSRVARSLNRRDRNHSRLPGQFISADEL